MYFAFVADHDGDIRDDTRRREYWLSWIAAANFTAIIRQLTVTRDKRGQGI